MKKRHVFAGALAFFCVTLAAAVIAVPWKDVLHGRIMTLLKSKGIENVNFEIDRIGLHDVSLSNVMVGLENPLIVDQIDVKFSPKELIDGNLQDISLSGLTIGATESATGWTLTGLDILPARSAGEEKAPIDIPAMLAALPFRTLTIEDSHLEVSGKSMSGTVPFRFVLGSGAMTLETTAATIAAGGAERAIGPVTVALAPKPDGATWAGTWSADSINLGEDVPVPQVGGKGALTLGAAQIGVEGTFADAANDVRAAFKANVDLADASKTGATLVSASFPFKGGRISTQNVALKMPAKIPVRVERVSVDELMQSMTGKKVTATGTLSGTIPVTIAKDMSYTFGAGSLRADKDGRISMPGTLIPGNNSQVALVREILEDLRYSLLSASLVPGADGRPGVALSLEGRNPAVYDGRTVKLNIKLTGDVLDFVRQNLMLFQSPEKFLEQELHE